MRVYELGFIMKPDLSEQDAQAAIDAVTQSLTAGGATIDKVDDWGKRKLAYRVRGFWNGHYVFIQYSAEDSRSLTGEVERRLRVADSIIKFMTIRIDEDLKRQKKAAERREKRAPRLAARAAARQAEAAPPKPATPGTPEPEKPAPADETSPAAAADAPTDGGPAKTEGKVETDDSAQAAAAAETAPEPEAPTVKTETAPEADAEAPTAESAGDSQAEPPATGDSQTEGTADEPSASE